MLRFPVILAAAALVCVFTHEPSRAAAHSCLTAAESRDAVGSENLAQPGVAQREAVRHAHADPLRSRLCRWNNELIYEITLLRRDGKVLHVFIAARNGLVINIDGP